MTDELDVNDDWLMQETVRVWLQDPISDRGYYCISILGNENGTLEQSVTSHWVGYTKTSPRYEIRKASLASGDAYREMLKEMKLPFSVVNTEGDLFIFGLIGGWAVMLDSIAERFFPKLIKPRSVAQSTDSGYIFIDSLPSHRTNHAPTKKLRMKIIKRDSYRCKVCGRSPNDYVDVELHVHHILPWSQGGLTEEANLITLCKTCHDGLDPHWEWSLSNLTGPRKWTALDDEDLLKQRLLWHMEAVRKQFDKLSQRPRRAGLRHG